MTLLPWAACRVVAVLLLPLLLLQAVVVFVCAGRTRETTQQRER